MEVLLQWLSTTLQDFQAIVGVQTSMASPTAMLLDVMPPAAGYTHAALSWSTLVISPRLLLVETRTDAPTWSSNLTAAWEHNPNTSGIKIRYRPSTNTKPLFAQVQATAADIAAVRARKGHATSCYHQRPTAPSINLRLWTRHPQMESGYILRRNMDWQDTRIACERRRTSPLASNATRARNRNTTTCSRNLRRFRPHRSGSSRNRGAPAVLVTTRPARSYSRIHCMPPPHHFHLGSDYHHPH